MKVQRVGLCSPVRDMVRRLGRDGTIAARLSLLAFLVFNANLRSITSLDTYATRVLPISIIREGNLDLDEFPFLHEYPNWLKSTKPREAYWVHQTRGHYISNYPVMPAILSVPVYVVPVLLGLTDGPSSSIGYNRTEIVATLLSKIAASAIVALSVGFIYLTLLRLTSRRGAVWVALAYAFATASWSSSSQGLWLTAWSQPLLALTFYCFVRAREEPRFAVYGGIPLALSVACRPPVIIFAAAFFAYVITYHRRQAVRFLLIPVIVGGLLVAYNLYYFGNLIGGYTALGTETEFGAPRLKALLGLLISPSRGMFTYSPILLFACAGIGAVLRRPREPVMVTIGVATVLTLIFYSSWILWDGGFSYGYRFLADLLPGLCLFLGVGWSWVAARPWRIGLFLVAAIFSIFIQVIGAFFFPCGWYDFSARQAAQHQERFWDWKDPEWLRCLRAGPVEPDGVRFLRSAWGK
jgi:hypothetical protein